ncbi:hypothetical protein [Enterobacter roggenkampii]|uniref:hypothetical protein n=1 Tax=Enterobacter roggenkampii TaxID=1812935 RepID=UPI00388E20E3
MTNNPLTDERLKWLHDAATELDNTKLKMTMKPSEMLWLTTELQEYRKELPGGLFELQNIKSDARSISRKLGDALERNSRQAIEIQEYKKAEPDIKTCKYCGGSGLFRWQQSANLLPCPCMGCTELAAPQ